MTASAKQNVLKVSRIKDRAAAASSAVGESGMSAESSGTFSRHIPETVSYPAAL